MPFDIQYAEFVEMINVLTKQSIESPSGSGATAGLHNA
jgi:hypothetical protein